ncbi:MAG: DUF4493 domain-containing protein [Bacteroidales bacterium]|nr:DUF4493 domain-containing protein [Bacteroidales bacterium]
MKHFTLIALAMCIVCSCDSLMMPQSWRQGELNISFVEDFKATKASGEIPDTNNFIISVTNSGGASIYYGTYGAAPEKMMVGEGTYTITARSCDFTSPKFDCPQYGDTQVAVVKAGESCSVLLNCTLVNAGMKLNVSPDFLTEYPSGILFLKSSAGRLMYGYAERRVAYFSPGSVSLVLSDSGKETTLFTRVLQAQQVLTVNISVASSSPLSSGTGLSIRVDTSKTYLSDSYTIGGQDNGKGSDKSSAFSVAQARTSAPMQEVWVYGYIVGGDLTSSKCSFDPPFSSRTNLILATKSSCSDKELCLSVQLQSGKIRDALNLVDHEEYLGKKIYLKGDLVQSYYGIPGLQCITEYSF